MDNGVMGWSAEGLGKEVWEGCWFGKDGVPRDFGNDGADDGTPVSSRRRRKRDRWGKGGWMIERNDTPQRRTKRQKYTPRIESSSDQSDTEMGEAGHSTSCGRVGRLPANRPLMKMTVGLLGAYQTIGGSVTMDKVVPTLSSEEENLTTDDDDGKMLLLVYFFIRNLYICHLITHIIL